MKAQYYFNGNGGWSTAEVLFVRPWEGEFAGPLVQMRETPNWPGYWHGFAYCDWGIGQLVAPRTLVIHKLHAWDFDKYQTAVIFRKFALIKCRRGSIASAQQIGKKRESTCEFFGKRQRVYIPHFSTPLAAYRSPIRQDAPLGWEI